jgi:5'-methylthioadenosine phosphorylase
VDLSETSCPGIILEIINKMGMNVHYGGTYICIEGPQFSTNAESELFKNMGGDIIGMKAQPEAKLAREAEICYKTIAGISDYNICGMPSSKKDSMKNMHQLIRNMNKIISNLMIDLPQENKDQCTCSNALKRAIITSRKGIPGKTIVVV